jgi:Kef-type K+ transport system membrane component KefB
VALGFIAYLIGGSLHWQSISRLGKSIAWITVFQSLGAWLIVTLVMVFAAPRILGIPNANFLNTYFPLALVLGAMAAATAPAATMAIIREYKARGPLTTTLLAVVALDDAIAVIAFAIAMGIAQPLAAGAGGMSLYHMLGVPALHIVQSIGIGVGFGFALIYLVRLVKSRSLLLVAVLGMIVLCVGLTNLLGVSLILANMVIGFVVANRAKNREMLDVTEGVEDVVYAVFFVLAGMHFDASVMRVAGVLAVLIVASRCTGKYFGTRIGAQISHASEAVKKYLGLALLPKAGVTMGLAVLAAGAFPTFGAIMFNGILASVIINELISPPLVRYALFKSGEQYQAVSPGS